jgi:hypothetical protein
MAHRPLIIASGEIKQLPNADLLLDQYDRPVGDYLSFTNNDGTTMLMGDIGYYFGSGAVKKARADAAATIPQLCFCVETSLANLGIGVFQLYGIIQVPTAPFVTNTAYYLSPTTAGAITATPPSTAGQYIIKVGFAYSTTTFHIKIERPILLS